MSRSDSQTTEPFLLNALDVWLPECVSPTTVIRQHDVADEVSWVQSAAACPQASLLTFQLQFPHLKIEVVPLTAQQ